MVRIGLLPLIRIILACLPLFLAAGCFGPSASVSGEVTYDGQPVKSGYVTFTPADGKGPSVGAPIKDGTYSAKDMLPGEKIVKVEASSSAGAAVQTNEDAEKRSKEWKSKVGRDGIIHTESVPANAEGNSQKHVINAGSQTLNLALKKPAGGK